jgi:hypothetical protein
MPLQAPPDPLPPLHAQSAPAHSGVGLQRNRPPTTPTEILGERPSLTSMATTTEHALADGTGAVAPESFDNLTRRRSKLPFVIGVLAVLTVGAVVFAFTRTEKPPTAKQAAVAPQPPSAIHVESIPPEEQPAPTPTPAPTPPPEVAVPPAANIEMPADRVGDKPSGKSDRRTKSGDKKSDKNKKDKAEIAKPPPPVELSRKAVAAKLQAVKRAYDAYKEKNGGRYDAEWNNLADFVMYHQADLEEVARRIESFSAKLRE